MTVSYKRGTHVWQVRPSMQSAGPGTPVARKHLLGLLIRSQVVRTSLSPPHTHSGLRFVLLNSHHLFPTFYRYDLLCKVPDLVPRWPENTFSAFCFDRKSCALVVAHSRIEVLRRNVQRFRGGLVFKALSDRVIGTSGQSRFH